MKSSATHSVRTEDRRAIARLIRSDVKGSPSTTSPSPFGRGAAEQVASRVHPGFGRSLRTADPCQLDVVLDPPAPIEEPRSTRISTPAPRSRSANSSGNVGGTVAVSTPSALHAFTVTPRETSSRGSPVAISSS